MTKFVRHNQQDRLGLFLLSHVVDTHPNLTASATKFRLGQRLLEAFEKPLERWDGAWIELKAEDWKELHATLEAPGLTLPELFSQGAKAEISPRAYLAFINAVRDAVDALPEELPS